MNDNFSGEKGNNFFFLPPGIACGILAPWPGIELTSPALEMWSLNHWTTMEVPKEIVWIEEKK